MGLSSLNTDYNYTQRENSSPSSPKRTNSNFSSNFSTLLQSSLSSISSNKKIRQKEDNNLESLMQALDFYEENLLKKSSQQNFLKYREHVRKITAFILKKQFSIQVIQDRRRQKEYEVVHYINKNLAEIMQEVLKRNPDTLMILRLMGEVRGLVLDVHG